MGRIPALSFGEWAAGLLVHAHLLAAEPCAGNLRYILAEAGQSYYFRTKTQVDIGRIQLVPVDPAEAQILLANASFSTFQIKK